MPRGCSSAIEQVTCSSAGIRGYLDADPDDFMRVGKDAFPSSLCGLWARKAVNAVADFPEWERIVLTVDSGASEIVVPPDVACILPLIHTSQAGTVYEAAIGEVVVNIGEKRADMITKFGNTSSMIMSFQAVV